MTRLRPSNFAQVALVAAWVALATAVACSRTDDPLEHYASGSQPSRGGTFGGAAIAGKSNGGQGNRGGASGSAAGEGGTGDGPTWPADFGCGDAPIANTPASGQPLRAALRAAAADCALWHYCRFEGGATQLEYELATYAESPTPTTLERAQKAYAQAMALWSAAELFRFGPGAASKDDAHHGQGLSALIYVWPEVDRCRVEEQVALQTYRTDIDSVFTSGRGLFALDYLLHYPGSDTVCASNKASAKKWAMLGTHEIAALKLQYATALGSDILQRIGQLRSAWAPDGASFRSTFVDAAGYPDEDTAMTVLAWGMFYIERDVKDYKLGIPAGYTVTSPVTLQESPYAGLLTENVRANLRGFRALFQGCGPDGEGLGFDDWLIEAGHARLAQDIVSAWQGAQAAADQFPRFDQASPSELEALYRAVKGLTDLLKNDLFGEGSPLSLDLPMGLGDDTD